MAVKSPTGILTRPITTIEKLAKRFTIKDSGCWEWNKKGRLGYGQFTVGGHGTKGAHRVMWELINGRPTRLGNYSLDHLCRNTCCVNPKHLEEVTVGTNTLRGEAVSAINLRKTHCDKGHPFDDEHTYFKKYKGHVIRTCLVCQRVWSKAWRQKHLPYVRGQAKMYRQIAKDKLSTIKVPLVGSSGQGFAPHLKTEDGELFHESHQNCPVCRRREKEKT